MIKDNYHMITGTEGQDEIYEKRQEMRDEMGIVFGQLFALKIQRHGNTCSLYIEDDGILHEKTEFSVKWIDDLENVLGEFKRLLKEKNIESISEHTNNLKW
jgi:hypothetical protein